MVRPGPKMRSSSNALTLFGGLLVLAVLWYYCWSYYVESVPHSSAYYDATFNPIPDACAEKTFPATSGPCKFAEAAVVAVPAPFEAVRARMHEAIASRFGLNYSGSSRFGAPPLNESLSSEIVGVPYKRIPDLGRWKAKDGYSFLLASVVSARSLGQPGVTLVELSRADHWRAWASREFHTGIQFPFPVRVDNSGSVVTSTELDLVGAVLGSYSGPVLVCPGWNVWRDESGLRALAEKAGGLER